MPKKKTHPIKCQIYIREDTFGLPVYVLLNLSEEEFIAWEKKRDIQPHGDDELKAFAGRAYSYVDKDRVFTSVVWVRNFNWDIKGYGTLLHELFHSVFRIFEAQNIPVNAQTQEFFALIHQRLYEQACHGYIQKEKRKLKLRIKS